MLILVFGLLLGTTIDAKEPIERRSLQGRYEQLHELPGSDSKVGIVFYNRPDGGSGATPVIDHRGNLFAIADLSDVLLDSVRGLHSFSDGRFVAFDGSSPGSGSTRIFVLLEIVRHEPRLIDVRSGIARYSVDRPAWDSRRSIQYDKVPIETPFAGRFSRNARGEKGVWVAMSERGLSPEYSFEQFLAISSNGFRWSTGRADFERIRAVRAGQSGIYNVLAAKRNVGKKVSEAAKRCEREEHILGQKGPCDEFFKKVHRAATGKPGLPARGGPLDYHVLVNLDLVK